MCDLSTPSGPHRRARAPRAPAARDPAPEPPEPPACAIPATNATAAPLLPDVRRRAARDGPRLRSSGCSRPARGHAGRRQLLGVVVPALQGRDAAPRRGAPRVRRPGAVPRRGHPGQRAEAQGVHGGVRDDVPERLRPVRTRSRPSLGQFGQPDDGLLPSRRSRSSSPTPGPISENDPAPPPRGDRREPALNASGSLDAPMAAVCDICGKKPWFGKSVTFSHKRNNRRWDPNMQRVRALVDGTPGPRQRVHQLHQGRPRHPHPAAPALGSRSRVPRIGIDQSWSTGPIPSPAGARDGSPP